MTEDQKIENIKERIKDLMEINLGWARKLAADYGNNNMGANAAMSPYDDLKLVLAEIESGEIYEAQE